MNIFLTGGTGFIGSYVVEVLANAGHTINILARNPEKVPSLKNRPNIVFHKAALDDLDAIDKAMIKPDALIHIALCWGDTGPDMIKNETLRSVELIDLAIKKGCKKILFTSSTAAVGYSNKNTIENAFRKPTDFYGATKGAVELFINAYANYHPEIAFNIIRPGYTFGNPVYEGSDMQPDSRINDICSAVQNNELIRLNKNDGTQFMWAGDLAQIYRQVIESDIKNEIFFGLAKNFTSWEQIARWAIKLTDSDSKIKLTDVGIPEDPWTFEMKAIKDYFNLSFDSTEHMKDHVQYIIKNANQ